MNKIKVMNDRLANMIAAGEVVERPASIIKELVENSIDANSKSIVIKAYNNGLKEITVIDDGVGISKEDLKLAFLRHATSKIKEEIDLERINTLGFRGEALAAIVAVSNVLIKSRVSEENGNFIVFDNGKIVDEGIVSLNIGTEITVKNLFYNTPARLKYLKSEYTERMLIIETFDKLALSNPNIRFKLLIDDKLVKETYGTNDVFNLIDNIYGSQVLKDIKVIDETFSNINVKGYLVSPKFTRPKRNDISIFVNGRYVKNFQLTNAVIDGYSNFLMTKRYPVALIFIKIDPYLLDVNIHPQKLEIKFANDSMLKYQLELIIKNALNNSVHEIPNNFKVLEKKHEQLEEQYTAFPLEFNYELKTNNSLLINEENINKKLPDLEYVGVLSGTYLLFQNEDGLFLVDQHAAEERVNYEYYLKFYDNYEIIVEEMLISKELDLLPSDFSVIDKYLEIFNKFGFYFDKNNHLLSHPSFLLEKDLELVITNMIFLIENNKEISFKVLLDDVAKSKSCKGSIKANHKLSRIEIDNLMKRLRNASNPYTCPHGRPTIINITNYQIERMFKRIV
ncbi:DNA mismatch repair endonuclease MutL [Haploplasma modicum]|uniref:DNA mismatch repair endonuclease MutL n=1 Tax=Haploplasma modicum TaxID=2150 RepID=UPI00214AEF0F|nr:DNA mismatch repair endonuclease MutL [Haploplasma modicum]MCR1809050.1 DNA mismatch repair endonuclease MutL [Haploplasma modicum]